MTRYLLDVNLLLALAWPNHEFHALAHRLVVRVGQAVATCALTELGFIRLSTNPANCACRVSASLTDKHQG